MSRANENAATDEEIHYRFTQDGMLDMVAFAQTPNRTSALNGSLYGPLEADRAKYRALATYHHDPRGHLLSLRYVWHSQVKNAQDVWKDKYYAIRKVDYACDEDHFYVRKSMTQHLATNSNAWEPTDQNQMDTWT